MCAVRIDADITPPTERTIMEDRAGISLAGMEARNHARSARNVAQMLRANIELRRAGKPSGEHEDYGERWESAAATCDEIAAYLDTVAEEEARNE